MDQADFIDNAESVDELGWDSTWLDLPPGMDPLDEIVGDAVAAQQVWYGLPVTGVLDSVTWQRIEFMRTLDLQSDVQPSTPSDHIYVAGQLEPVPFEVVTWDDPGGMRIKRTYKKKGKTKTRYSARKEGPLEETITRVVVHWTGTKTPQHTYRAAWNVRRSVSTHIEIGGDGTIFQLVDLADATYNAGKGWINRCSIGVDLTLNPARKRVAAINDALAALGLQRRPIISDKKVRGWRPGPFLGATPEQLKSLRELMRWFSERFGIPMEAPCDDIHKPDVIRAVCGIGDATPAKLPPGWLQHAHFKKGRWDTACVSLPLQLELARNE